MDTDALDLPAEAPKPSPGRNFLCAGWVPSGHVPCLVVADLDPAILESDERLRVVGALRRGEVDPVLQELVQTAAREAERGQGAGLSLRCEVGGDWIVIHVTLLCSAGALDDAWLSDLREQPTHHLKVTGSPDGVRVRLPRLGGPSAP